MDKYDGKVSIGRVYYTIVYARSAQHARTLVANEYQRLHPNHYIADILRNTSVRRAGF